MATLSRVTSSKADLEKVQEEKKTELALTESCVDFIFINIPYTYILYILV